MFATQVEGLSTPEVFAVFDELNPKAGGQPERDQQLLQALRTGDVVALGEALSNDLQPAALHLAPPGQPSRNRRGGGTALAATATAAA